MALLDRLDRPTRQLTFVGAAALVMTVAAVIAALSATRAERPRFEPQAFFPALEQGALEAAAELVLQNKDETLRIVRQENGAWVLPDKDNYPAKPDPLRQTLIGLADLTQVEPQTANPDWHKHLELGAPDEGGTATRITLKDKQGKALADLLVGKEADIATFQGLGHYHVRKPGEDQTWLARGTLETRLDRSDWIAGRLFVIDAAEIQSADVNPPEGPAYRISKEKKEDAEFKLADLPEGRAANSPFELNSVATAITDLEIEDVRLASDFDFSKAATVRYRTFGGLELTVRTHDAGGTVWSQFEARFDGAPEEGAAEDAFATGNLAADINKRVSGWAFQLPDYAGRQMRSTRESLLQPETASPTP